MSRPKNPLSSRESRKQSKITELAKKVYEHKYRYYEKDDPIISDFRFDFMERKLGESLDEEQSLEYKVYDMVGFDSRHPWYDELVKKVEKE